MMTPQTTVSDWLRDNQAHHDLVTWARPYGVGFEQAFAECPRGDWLLGIAARGGLSHHGIGAASLEIARTVLPWFPESERRPAQALETLAAWLSGGTADACRTERRYFEQLEPSDMTIAAAVQAIASALAVVDEPDAAPVVAQNAAHAAMLGVSDCAMMAAVAHEHAQSAAAVRRHIPVVDFVRLATHGSAA